MLPQCRPSSLSLTNKHHTPKPQAALLAGRTNKALVGREEFSQAVLRSVAGIEKKRSILQGLEKDVVARHEVRRCVRVLVSVVLGWSCR